MTTDASESVDAQEEGDVLRRVQRTGVASLTVTLPKWWVELVGVHHGTTLRFHDLGGGRIELSVETAESRPGHPRERALTVDARNAAPHLIPRLIVGAYVTGQDQVIVTGHLARLQRNEINRAVAKLLGTSIVEDGKDRLVIQTFVDPTRYTVPRLLERLVHLLLDQVEVCRRGVLGVGPPDRTQIAVLEDEIDKIYRLMVRQLMLACGHYEVAKEVGVVHHHLHMGYRMIAKLFEDLGDHLFALGENLYPSEGGRWNVPEDVTKEIADRLERFATLLRRTATSFENASAEEANLVLNDVHSDVPDLRALARNLPARVPSQPDSLAVERVLEFLLDITQMLHVVNEVTINRAVDLEEFPRPDARFSINTLEPLPPIEPLPVRRRVRSRNRL